MVGVPASSCVLVGEGQNVLCFRIPLCKMGTVAVSALWGLCQLLRMSIPIGRSRTGEIPWCGFGDPSGQV